MVSTRRSSANAVAKETQPMVRSTRDRHRTEALARGNPKFGPPPVAKGPPWAPLVQVDLGPAGRPGRSDRSARAAFPRPGVL